MAVFGVCFNWKHKSLIASAEFNSMMELIKLMPLTCSTLLNKLALIAFAFSRIKASICLVNLVFSSSKASTLLSTSLGFFNASFTKFRVAKFWLKYSSAALAVIASILLTPAATAPSETILNKPICPVLFTCVPPHNSIL